MLWMNYDFERLFLAQKNRIIDNLDPAKFGNIRETAS